MTIRSFTAPRALILSAIAVAALALSAGATVSAPASATTDTAAETALFAGAFQRERARIDGGWDIVTRADGVRVLRFDDAFATRNGPDLKVFLSPQTVDAATGGTATDGAILLGVLTDNNGAQEYEIPADVSLEDFASVLIHCEAFSVLWGGGDLA